MPVAKYGWPVQEAFVVRVEKPDVITIGLLVNYTFYNGTTFYDDDRPYKISLDLKDYFVSLHWNDKTLIDVNISETEQAFGVSNTLLNIENWNFLSGNKFVYFTVVHPKNYNKKKFLLNDITMRDIIKYDGPVDSCPGWMYNKMMCMRNQTIEGKPDTGTYFPIFVKLYFLILRSAY